MVRRSTMNLISVTHHSCKRREYAFMILWEYTIIFFYFIGKILLLFQESKPVEHYTLTWPQFIAEHSSRFLFHIPYSIFDIPQFIHHLESFIVFSTQFILEIKDFDSWLKKNFRKVTWNSIKKRSQKSYQLRHVNILQKKKNWDLWKCQKCWRPIQGTAVI